MRRRIALMPHRTGARRPGRNPVLPLLAALAIGLPQAAQAQLASGLAGSVGSTVGPDGALYVPESAAGRITRIDPSTGATSTFAESRSVAPWTLLSKAARPMRW